MSDPTASLASLGTEGRIVRPLGPVSEAFLKGLPVADKAVSGIMGPVASGKTTMCLTKLLREARRMKPNRREGDTYVTDFRVATVRETYRELEETVIRSWHSLVPKTYGEWSGAPPPTHRVRMPGNWRGVPTVVDFEIVFFALAGLSVENVMRGWEGSAGYLNEADLLSPDVLSFLRSRIGRFPSPINGGPPEKSFVLLDFNAPDIENYLYKTLVEDLPPGWEFHRQPSGFSSRAEYPRELGADYYRNLAVGQEEWWIRRFIEAEFGYSRNNAFVYDGYRDQVHCAAQPIPFEPARRLIIGVDAGGTPAGAFRQIHASGKQVTIDEIVTPPNRNTGPTSFGKMLRAHINERYPGLRLDHLRVVADPASFDGGDSDGVDPAWVHTFSKALGAPVGRAAKNNQWTPRYEAVAAPMRELIDAQPAWQLSPTCKRLRAAYNGGYQFKATQQANGTALITQKKPLKNEASHVAEADQYAALGAKSADKAIGGSVARNIASRPAPGYGRSILHRVLH